MRRIAYVTLAAVFCCFLFGQAGTVDDPYPVYASSTVKVAWDNPPDVVLDQLYAAEVAVFSQAGAVEDMAQRVLTKQVVFAAGDSKTEIPLRPEIEALPDGTYYTAVRIQRNDLVWSGWSEERVIRKNWIPWSPPSGCRLRW